MSWAKVKLGEIAETSSGGTPNRGLNEYWEGGNIPWIKSGQLKDCTITEADEFITPEGLNNSSAKLFKEGTLLLALYGATAGKLGILGIEAATNQAVCSIVPKSNVADKKYLYYYLLSIRNKIISDSAGGAQPNISQNYVREIFLPLPPLHIQQQIADILDKADALRQKDQMLLQKYDELAQSIFYDMFGDPVKNEKGWDIIKLGECIDYIGDIGSNGANAVVSKNLKMTDLEDYALMVRTTNLSNNDFTNNLKYVTKETYNFFSKSKIYGGELIMNKIGSAGDFWIMPNLNRPVSLGLNQFVIRLKNLNSRYLYSYLSTEYCKAIIKSSLNGAVTKSITKTAVKEIPLLYPPINIQNRYELLLKKILSQKSKLDTFLSADLFSNLLDKYFS